MSNEYLIKNYLQKLPQIQNLDRRASLYCKFSHYKELKPSVFEQNVDFWSKVLRDLCELGWLPNLGDNKLSIGFLFNNKKFQHLFNINGELPMSLEAVLEELYLKGEIITLDSYILKKNSLLISPSWTTQIFYNLISSIFGPLIPPNFNDKFIVLKKSTQCLVNIIFKYVLENVIIYPITDTLTYYEEFFENILPHAIESTSFSNLNCLNLSPEDIKLILRSLEEVGVKVQISNNLNTKSPSCYLKFPQASDISNYLKNNSIAINTQSFNELDIKILTLKQAITSHNIQIRKLHHQFELQTSLAKQNIEKSLNQRAKLQLKKRKQIEVVLNQAENSLNNLTTILFGIRDAHSDNEILQTYKLGLDELNEVLNTNNMNVDDVMDSVSDTLTGVDQISQALNLNNTQDLEDEIEDEFNQLLKSEETKKQAEKASSQDVDNIINQLEGLQINKKPINTTVDEVQEKEKLNPILN